MARANVKKLRIPIEESLFTFGTGYEIGPRLRLIQNFVRRPMYSAGVTGFPFGYPEVPAVAGPALQYDAYELNGMGYWIHQGAHFYIGGSGHGGTNARRIWDLATGLDVPVIGASLGNNAVVYPWSFAFAPNVSEPTTFLVNELSPKKKIHPNSSTGAAEIVDWTPIFDPDGSLDFAIHPRIAYYHLNRVWIAYTSSTTRRSIVYYTDPLQPDIIRGTSFLDIPDECVTIFRASASDIDLGAQAHLIFGCKGSLYVLDGDPTQGNAVFRQMRKTFGITSAHHAVETSEGAVFLATDSKIYLLPRGATEPIAINQNIQGQFSHNDVGIRFGWKYPYLYVMSKNQQLIWICDLSDLRKEPYWSGPHTGLPGMNGMISDVPYSTASYMSIFEPAQSYRLVAAGQLQLIRTGYIFEEDSDVVFNRAWFDFQPLNFPKTYTLRVYNNRKLQEEFTITVPGFTGISDVTLKIQVVAQPQFMEFGDYFWMELESDFLVQLRNWHIEYRVEPRKD